jgi:hypothetical protein
VRQQWRKVKHSPVLRAGVKNDSILAYAFVEYLCIKLPLPLPLPLPVKTTTLGDITGRKGPLPTLLTRAINIRIAKQVAVSSLVEWLSAVCG